MSTFNHRLVRLSVKEQRRWGKVFGTCDFGRYSKDGPCRARVEYVASYRYFRRDRKKASSRELHLCILHAADFARRHDVEADPGTREALLTERTWDAVAFRAAQAAHNHEARITTRFRSAEVQELVAEGIAAGMKLSAYVRHLVITHPHRRRRILKP